jgi:hypothetical protein
MLLSLYASFRWARKGNYVLKMAALAIVTSLLSAYFGLLPFLSVFFGPFTFLSFPFYDRWDERRLVLPQPYNYSDRLNAYEIRFLTMSVFQLVPQGPFEGSFDGGFVRVINYRVIFLNMEIGAVPSEFAFAFSTLLLFFFLVNVAGALLGFLMIKVRIIQKTDETRIPALVGVALSFAILLTGIWLSTLGEVKQTSPYYFDYDTSSYTYGAFAFIWFAITWLIILYAEHRLEQVA